MNRFKKYLYPLILISICVLICFLNYTPGTFLSGWDTIHPEFNFSLNFSRLFSGVWRQEQGLGAVAGHSHMADLPRVIFLFIISPFFKLNFLRYAYIFLCFIVGPLGIYYLIKYLFSHHKHFQTIAFLSALFYIFNLSTLQQFIVPFEMFTTQYAFLPFIILFTLKYLQKPKTFYLINFSIFTLLAAPQAYAAHLWYAFFGVYLAFLFFYFILHKNLLCFKKIITLIVFTLVLNSFWLLPNLYFIKNDSSVTQDAKVNRLFSQEYRLQNRATGYLSDVALIKGFYFNWQIYNPQTQKFDNLTDVWDQHLNLPVQIIGFIIFTIAIFGLIMAFVKKHKILISLSPTFIIPFILLANHTPPFSWFFDLIIKISLFEEAFRFIFTKVSILFAFSVAIYLAFAISLIFDFLAKKTYLIIFSLSFIIGLITICFPYFQGQLIHPNLKINIPNSYFEFWKYSQSLSTGTVLPLPLNSFSGWQYYSWGYQGSGFIWFGLKQNILDRDFDRWSTQNEEAYRELFYTLYSKNTTNFFQTIEKYNLDYILWDTTSVTSSSKNQQQIVFSGEIKDILNQFEQEGKITLLKNFDNIYFYKINRNSTFFKIKQLNNTAPNYQWNFYDQAYFDSQDYKTIPNQTSIIYPYRQLIDKRERVFDKNLFGQNLITLNPDQIDTDKIKSNVVDYSSLNKNIGSYISLNDLAHNIGLKIGFKSKNITGLPLRICIKNIYNNLCMVYEELGKNKDFTWDYYLIPPMDNFSGYTISLDNISLGNYQTHNQLESVTVDIVDFDAYQKTKTQEIPTNSELVIYPKEIQISPFLYKTNISTSSQNPTLIFSQNYNSGWLAFSFNGLKPVFLKDHVLVNNWANGWQLPSELKSDKLTSEIYIFFWPQLLEFFGFLLLIPTGIWIFKKKK